MKIKCISLWQPWATLIAIEAKLIETRHFYINHRGPLLIHAAKTTQELSVCDEYHFKRVLAAAGYLTPSKPLPLGAIVAMVDLVDCVRTEKIRDSLSEQERAFGNYADGRYGWKMANVQIVEPAVAMRGMQGLFEVEWPVSPTIGVNVPEIKQAIEERPDWVQGSLL